MYIKVICAIEINKLALLYNSVTDKIVTIPAIICKYINSKLLGTIKPRSKTVSTCVKSPNLASKKAFKTSFPFFLVSVRERVAVGCQERGNIF